MNRAAFALLLALACPSPAQDVSGDREHALGSHGVLTISGAPDAAPGDEAISWDASRHVTLKAHDGGRTISWSAPAGEHEIRVLYIHWEARALVNRTIPVSVLGAPPPPAPSPDDGVKPDPPRPPPGPGIPVVSGEIRALVLYDPSSGSAAAERLASPALQEAAATRNAKVIAWDIGGALARDAGYTADWLRRVGAEYGVDSAPAVVYFEVVRGGGRVVRVEPVGTGVDVLSTIISMRGGN